jgi:hypothetical protein
MNYLERVLPTIKAKTIVAIMLFSFSLLASPKIMACCGVASTITYYSDSTYTDVVGQCQFNCSQTEPSCWGIQTDFHRPTIYQCCSCERSGLASGDYAKTLRSNTDVRIAASFGYPEINKSDECTVLASKQVIQGPKSILDK